MDNITKILIEEFSLKEFQAENTIKLIDEGNTIPFIARHRKEATGELSDEVLRNFFDRLTYLRNINEKREEIKRLIDEQGNLTPELVEAIEKASTITELDDIYRPFRPKRRTRATIAKEKGLEPLAQIILEQGDTDIEQAALDFIDIEKEVPDTESAIAGACDIIAEIISDKYDSKVPFVEDISKDEKGILHFTIQGLDRNTNQVFIIEKIKEKLNILCKKIEDL